MKLPLNLEEMKRISKIYIDASIPWFEVYKGSIHAYILKDKDGSIILGRIFKSYITKSQTAEQYTMDILLEDLNDTLDELLYSLNFDFNTDSSQVFIKKNILGDERKLRNKNLFYIERHRNWEADLLCHIGTEGIFKYSFKELFTEHFSSIYLTDSLGGIFNNTLSEDYLDRYCLIANSFLDFSFDSEYLKKHLSNFIQLVPFDYSLQKRNFMLKGFVSFILHLESYENPLLDDSLFYEYLSLLEESYWDTIPLKEYLSSCLEKSYGV